jgi:hypothetical protein
VWPESAYDVLAERAKQPLGPSVGLLLAFPFLAPSSVHTRESQKESANALLRGGAKSIGALVAAKLRQSFKPRLGNILIGTYYGGLNLIDEKSVYSRQFWRV